MNLTFKALLEVWPRNYLTTADILIALQREKQKTYHIINRAIKKKILIPLRRGLYLIGKPYSRKLVNQYELAQSIYFPSYISLESALSYHGWIPEAVYTTTSVSTKRAKEINTPIGAFSYQRIPRKNFYLGVSRIKQDEEIYFIADPWKALADYIYVYKKYWKGIIELSRDLRIEMEELFNSKLSLLHELALSYPSPRVRKQLKIFSKELV